MAYTSLGSRVTYYVATGTSTPDSWDIRGYGKAYYDQTSSDIINNQSRIKLEYGVTIKGSWYGQYKVTGTIYQKINNTWTSISSTTYTSSLATQSAGTYSRGTLTDIIIPHDTSGNAQVRVGVSVTGTSGIIGTQSYLYIYDLPQITEQPEITEVVTEETNTTLTGYSVPNNTYVNFLSNKKYTLTLYNPRAETVSTYEVFNGESYDNKRATSTSSTNIVTLNFNNIDMVLSPNTGKPKMFAEVNFSGGRYIYTPITGDDMAFINYQKPQFIPTSTTTKRNGQLSGKVYLNASGTYFNGTIGTLNQGGTYKPTIKYKFWKSGSSEPSSYGYTVPAASITISSGTFSISNYEIGSDNPSATNYFDYNYSYNVKILIQDSFGSTTQTTTQTTVIVGEPVWTEYKDRVDFKKATINKGTTTIDSTGITTNKLKASNIEYGTCTLSASDTTVYFTYPYTTPPKVFLTPNTSTNGVIAAKVGTITTTYFIAWIGGSGFNNIDFSYLAIGE